MGRNAVLVMPWIAAALALGLVALWISTDERESETPRATLDVAASLSADVSEGYARADVSREFRFPADHGAHDGFKTEWWYFTGNLETQDGRRFGYQLTFFRSALTPRPEPREGTFAAHHAWMAHFTLSDVAGGEFHAFERFARESGGIAGASTAPLRVWLRDWSCDFGADGAPIKVAAEEGGLSIELELRAAKSPVLHGEDGRSRKNAGVGNASYYYSLTRLESTGSVRKGDATFRVRGSSWMDREWMSSELEPDQVGWDWFALQLDDGSELMWYRLRRNGGGADPFDAGSLVLADGERVALGAAELEITESATWRSPRTNVVYPARWRLRDTQRALDLDVKPVLAGQELDLSFRYWEGAVDVEGWRDGRAVHGRGYVELVGYGPRGSARAPR
ncbi:MAG TPA: lipocalin-like domain-containing protein [Planctomycetota bacterium]|nr:lipocalin-like domain-containing protein [Planctomycetota bacterium]